MKNILLEMTNLMNIKEFARKIKFSVIGVNSNIIDDNSLINIKNQGKLLNFYKILVIKIKYKTGVYYLKTFVIL